MAGRQREEWREDPDIGATRLIERLHDFQLVIWLGAAVTLIMIIVAIWPLLDPAPPRVIRIATGAPGGFYAKLGSQFQLALQKSGVKVELVNTAGSVENIRLLLEDNSVDFAFVQGGITRRDPREDDLKTLASLAIEPLWVFSRKSASFSQIETTEKLRIAVGERGSGTRDLVLRILALLNRENDVVAVEIGGQAAADSLIAGEIDYAAFVTSLDTRWVQQLLRAPDITLAEPSYPLSLVRALPFTNAVHLPQRVLDFQQKIPRKDLTILGVATSLVATSSAHPAIKQLLLSKSHEIVDGQAIFGTRGQFPSKQLIQYPLDDEAVRYFRYGPTPVRRYLPYWQANLVERFWFLLLPIATLLIPLLGFGPTAFDWSMRRRIYRWYRALADIENAADQTDSANEVQHLLTRLDELQEQVKGVHVSLPFRRELYALRAHIAFVKQGIRASRQDDGPEEPAIAPE